MPTAGGRPSMKCSRGMNKSTQETFVKAFSILCRARHNVPRGSQRAQSQWARYLVATATAGNLLELTGGGRWEIVQ
jgi:hypothetical protein